MNRFVIPFAAASVLSACVYDETLSAYAVTGKTYHLTEINGAAPESAITLELGPNGAISGQAPCNRYNTSTEDPYPWLKITAIIATKMACPALSEESAYFDALESMTLSEAAGPILLLSNDAGDEMEFRILN